MLPEFRRSVQRYSLRKSQFSRAWLYISLLSVALVCLGLVFRYGASRSNINEKNVHRLTTISPEVFNTSTKKGEFTKRPKLILYWSRFLGAEDIFVKLDDGAEPFKNCPVSNCLATKNRFLLNESDALLFHPLVTPTTDLPSYRLPRQKWIFLHMEPPRNSPLLEDYTNFFNWTMSYRLDSDIYYPYGKVVPFAPKRRHPLTTKRISRILTTNLEEFRGLKESNDSSASDVHFDYDTFIKAKTKGIAWVASDCWTSSRREDYVKELSHYIPVDVYGKCGNLSCAWGEGCFQRIGREYKFYLAFENSICKDYVTEKMFHGLTHGLVPIVFGIDAHYQMAPRQSFIDAHKFDSPKALATYLQQLMSDDKLYEEYLRWNDNFKPERNAYAVANRWCDLCQALNDEQMVKKTTVYPDIKDYWITQAQCKNVNEGMEPFRRSLFGITCKLRDLIAYKINSWLDSGN